MTIVIDSTTYDVPIISIKESADFLDKYAERTEDGVLHRELIGVYRNYQIVFGSGAATTELAALWLKLTEPVESHEVTVPDYDGVEYTFNAYFSNVKRELRKVKTAQTFWRDLTVNFVAMEPARTPA
jgi:phosphoserine aminotransferase